MHATNEEIAGLFENMATLLEMKGDAIFKIRAYQRAARTIGQLPFPLDNAVRDGMDLKDIPGIGAAISGKIQEMVATGSVASYDRLKGKLPDGTLTLMKVPGIGPKTAMLITRELGAGTIESVEAAALDGRLAALPRMGRGRPRTSCETSATFGPRTGGQHEVRCRRGPQGMVRARTHREHPSRVCGETSEMTQARRGDRMGAPWQSETVPLDLAMEEPPAARHMKEAMRSGEAWHQALLEAVGMWTLPAEEFQGRHYNYLIAGEAFDWLLLAERLCQEMDGMVPTEEKEQLLFRNKLPEEVTASDFREMIGYSKHRAFLNYWYGVVVEEALQLAVEEEVRKQHRARGFSDSEDLVEEAFVRLYQDTRTNLLNEFLRERADARRKSLSLTELKEFTYRLFRKRLKIWDPARVASDTRKGLEKLHRLWPSSSYPGT